MHDSDRHPIDLDQLSPKEWLLLSTRAELLCVGRLSALATELEGSDEALSTALAGMADDERAHLQSVRAFDDEIPWPALLKVDEGGLAVLLATHLPTLCRGPSSRDASAVKAFVQVVEAESTSFYRMLAARARTPELQTFFEQMAQAEEAHAGNLSD
jgi:hypothetical protein